MAPGEYGYSSYFLLINIISTRRIKLGPWLYTWTAEGITRQYAADPEWNLTPASTNQVTVLSSSDVNMFEISPNHQLIAWGTDTQGDENYTVHIRDINQGIDLPVQIHQVGSMEAWQALQWSFEGDYLLYTSHVASLHANRCYRRHVTQGSTSHGTVITLA